MTRNTHDVVNDHFGTANADQIASGTPTAGDIPVSAGTGTPAVWTAPFLLTGTADPTAGGGVAHPQPAIYLRDNSGTTEIWTPTGAGATAWQKVTIP